MSRASSLLQKANHQLRGERVPLKSQDEDELSNYLSQLAQKTGHHTKSINFEDYGDHISISSDSNVLTSHNIRGETPPLGTVASRFLKKKPPACISTVPDAQVTSPAKSTPGSTKFIPQKKTLALDKAKALGAKITNVGTTARKSGSVLETDTDDSVSLGVYMRGSVDQLKSVSEKSIGRDGTRFLKSTKVAGQTKDVSDSVFTQKIEVSRPSTPSKSQQRPDRDVSMSGTTPVVPEYARKGQVKYTGNTQMTSEEESLADFINRSSQDEVRKRALKSAERYKNRERQSPDIFKRTPSPPLSRSLKRVPSPIHKWQLSRSPSQESDNVDSIQSEIIDTQDSESSGNIFNVVNLMDDTLEAIPLSSEPVEKKKKRVKKSRHRKSKPKAKSQKPSPSVFKVIRKEDALETKSLVKTSDSFFGNFGLHTVDELLGGSDINEDRSASDTSEIVTERLDVFTAKKRNDSLSSIATDVGLESAQNYTDDFDESVTERIGQSSVQVSKQVRWSVHSEVRTEYNDETTQGEYDDKLNSDTESYCRTRSYRSDRSTESEADEYTSDTDIFPQSYSNSKCQVSPTHPASKPATKSVEIQTACEPGLGYTWNMNSTGLAMSGPSLGLDFVNPPSIASHVVSADALEAMTLYSPCMLALHDLLKQQMILSQNFLTTQQRIYEASTAGLESNYKYTTLRDTKEYIRKHRKPRLTFQKALKMVTKEMAR